MSDVAPLPYSICDWHYYSTDSGVAISCEVSISLKGINLVGYRFSVHPAVTVGLEANSSDIICMLLTLFSVDEAYSLFSVIV